MGWANTIHGGGAPSLTASVYYTGTDALYEGYALCYDFNAADVNQENETLTAVDVGEEYWADARRVLVEKPNEGNKLHFAGVVSKHSHGFTGPGWVQIHVPGSVCNIHSYSDSDHERSAGIASGQLFNLVPGQYYFMDGGLPGKGAAMTLQDVDRSTTAGLVMAELMAGVPSGGYVNVSASAIAGTGGALSALVGSVLAYHGVYNVNFGTNACGCVSVTIAAANGKFIGQRVIVKCTATTSASNCTVARDPVLISTAQIIESTDTLATLSMIVATGFSLTIARASDATSPLVVDLEWNGRRWVLQSTDSVAVISN